MGKKNLIVFLICFFMIFNVSIPFANASDSSDDIASAKLGSHPILTNISAVQMGTDKNTVRVETKLSREGWQLLSANTTSAYLNINIADSFAFEVDDGTEFAVEVDYYDMDNGVFDINYDALDNIIRETEIKYVASSGKWKTAKFIISDAYFGNRLDGYDMRVCVRSSKINRSMGNVLISEVRIAKKPIKNTVLVKSINTSELGNIFGNGEEKQFDVVLENMSDAAKSVEITYAARDKQQNTRWSKSEKLDFESREKKELTVNADFARYGLYDFEVTVTDGVFKFTKGVPFSFVNNDEPGKRNYKFGYNTHFGQNGNDSKEGFEVLDKSGAGFIRKSFYWSNVENNKGSLDITRTFGDLVKYAGEYKYRIQCLLAYGNTAYGMNHAQTYPTTDEQIEGFVRYCEYITNELNRNGIDVQSYEIWNEPNLKSFNQTMEPAAAYAKFASRVEEALHKIHPEIEVGMLALANIHAETTKDWAKEVIDSGLVDNVNSLTLHNYNYSSYPEEVIVERMTPYKEMFKEHYGREPHTHLTEWGYSAYRGIAETEYIQGLYDVRQYLYMIGTDICDTCTYYDFANDGAIETYIEHMHGAVDTQNHSLSETPYAAKESFVGFTNMNKLLRNAECSKKISEQKELYSYMYQRDDGANVVAFWTQKDPATVTLKFDCNKIKLYDWYGNSNELTSDDGCFTFNANAEPYYIEGSFTDCSVADNPVELSQNSLTMAEGDSVYLNINDQSQIDFETSIQTTDGIEVDKIDDSKYRIISKAASGKQDRLYIALQKGESKCGYLELSVDTTEPIDSAIYVNTTGAQTINRWKGQILITNNSVSEPVKGTITLLSPDSIADNMYPIKFESIPGGCTGDVTFDLPTMSKMGMYDVKYRIDTDTGLQRTYEQKIDFTAAVLTDKPPKIDGVIEKGEWNKKSTLIADDISHIYMSAGRVWNGKNDLSTETNIMFDKDNLYMCVNVLDDKFFGEMTNGDIWQNDSVQFGIAFEKSVTDVMIGGTFTEIALSKAPDRDVVWRDMAEGNELELGMVETAEVAIKRNGNYTCYELKIPWTEIKLGGVDISTIDKIGFSMLVNDNDGTGRKGWAEYGSGIGKTKDISLFTFLCIAK